MSPAYAARSNKPIFPTPCVRSALHFTSLRHRTLSIISSLLPASVASRFLIRHPPGGRVGTKRGGQIQVRERSERIFNHRNTPLSVNPTLSLSCQRPAPTIPPPSRARSIKPTLPIPCVRSARIFAGLCTSLPRTVKPVVSSHPTHEKGSTILEGVS